MLHTKDVPHGRVRLGAHMPGACRWLRPLCWRSTNSTSSLPPLGPSRPSASLPPSCRRHARGCCTWVRFETWASGRAGTRWCCGPDKKKNRKDENKNSLQPVATGKNVSNNRRLTLSQWCGRDRELRDLIKNSENLSRFAVIFLKYFKQCQHHFRAVYLFIFPGFSHRLWHFLSSIYETVNALTTEATVSHIIGVGKVSRTRPAGFETKSFLSVIAR